MKRAKFVGLVLLGLFVAGICLGPWVGVPTSPLQMILGRSASIIFCLAALLWLFRHRSVSRLTGWLIGHEPSNTTSALLLLSMMALGLAVFAGAWTVTTLDLKAKGFASYDDFLAAAAVGAHSNAEYQRFQKKLSDAAEQKRRLKAAAAAAEQAGREVAAAREAALERLVVGRWVLPIDKAGEIITIRKTDDGYEGLVQFEHGQSMTYHLKKVGRRYAAHDDFGTYFEVLKDGQLQLGDRKGPIEVIGPLVGHPRTAKEIDAAIEAAFVRAQAAHDEERCRKDANCWGDRFRRAAIPLCANAVEHGATYDYRWTNGWFEEKFVSGALWHGRHGRERGLVDYVGDKLMLQNGFGAWQNVIYACTFDTRLGVPVGLVSRPGHLPTP